jgi:hypothetical protein
VCVRVVLLGLIADAIVFLEWTGTLVMRIHLVELQWSDFISLGQQAMLRELAFRHVTE